MTLTGVCKRVSFLTCLCSFLHIVCWQVANNVFLIILNLEHVHFLYFQEPVTAVSWGHSDRKYFVATKNMLHLVKVSREIPSLQSMCQALVAGTLPSRAESFDLVLPTKLKVAVAGCYDPLIQVSDQLIRNTPRS